MKRMFLVLALAATVSMAGAAMGQGPGGFKKKGAAPAAQDDGVKKLESELDKLRSQLRELEELVNKAKAASAAESKAKASKGDVEKKERKDFGPGGFSEKKEGRGFGPGGSVEKKGLVRLWADTEFRKFDANGDGKLNEDEMPAALRKELPLWDKNGDGLIDQDEYRTYFVVRFEDRVASSDKNKQNPNGFGPGGPFPGGRFERKEGKGSEPEGTPQKKDRKGFGPPAGGSAAPASIEERLDRILRELEDIRREMKNC